MVCLCIGIEKKIELPPVPKSTGHTAAVLGSGPAGLAAAR